MADRKPTSGGELFIVDNSDAEWKVLRYLRDWTEIAHSFDIATGYFEIGALLALDGQWQKLDKLRILMGSEVSGRTRKALLAGIKAGVEQQLDASLEREKETNDFLHGVPAIVGALRAGQIQCRAYTRDKFHAKAYITHAKAAVIGSAALVGSSNLTVPGLTHNVELNIQVRREVDILQEWYERHWNEAEDITADILRVVERHTRDYTPFEVYARALHEFCRLHEITDSEWLEKKSRVWRILDPYQKKGFQDLMATAGEHRGAFLCDSVGLGKTFIGLMVIEYLIERQRQRVVLLVPKAARKCVWETTIQRYAPHLLSGFLPLMILNHTDLLRKPTPDVNYPAVWQDVKEHADAIVIDEAHHFRNPGVRAEEGERKSHYWQFYDIAEGKQLFLLTATPINNRLLDLQHMIELFSRHQADYFKAAPLGIHSLPGHFRKMEKALEVVIQGSAQGGTGGPVDTNQVEAERVLSNDALFRALVEQRSRAYVKKSQQQHGGKQVHFPTREDPNVVPYRLKKTYGRLLDMVEDAFDKKPPLFSLAVYYPLRYYCGPDKTIDPMKQGRQIEVASLIRVQFLKRFESSARAFEMSCETLLTKLLAWATKHAQTDSEKGRLERWKRQHAKLIGYVHERQHDLFDEEADEDLVTPEMLEDIEELPRSDYRVDEILAETFLDLDQLAAFLDELAKFKSAHDDKLKALVKLLKTDPVLESHKVLIFSEYMATARYLRQELKAAGIEGVDQVDSGSDRDRGDIIRQFAPYYNGSSSATLAEDGLKETRVLISTDVLSEGLNLQDATRLINYDLHWNPVRLMQRIGRVDRRLNPDTEAQIVAEHPHQAPLRGTVAFWNFLPPEELDRLLGLYARVARKTVRISKTFGIEGRKLLTPQDEYDALRDFTRAYEGETSPIEDIQLEYEKLQQDYPDIIQRVEALPGRVFSGKAHPSPHAQAVFFCYALPAPPGREQAGAKPDSDAWSEEHGERRWYLFDLATEAIADDPTRIIPLIRSTPDTPRKHDIPNATLSEIRAKVEGHIRKTYLRQVQAPVGVRPVLKAWMELS